MTPEKLRQRRRDRVRRQVEKEAAEMWSDAIGAMFWTPPWYVVVGIPFGIISLILGVMLLIDKT